jgi:hypothetical protein
MPLPIRILKSLCLTSLLLAAFDGGRYLTAGGFNADLPMRSLFDFLLIDVILGFLIAFSIMRLPDKKRIFGAFASIALAFAIGVGITTIMPVFVSLKHWHYC